MEKISLADYDIFVGSIWDSFNEFLNRTNYSKIVILVDENTREFCFPILLSKTELQDYELIQIPSGEKHKNIETCNFIWQQMIEKQIDRKALMINLGGGVIGDMGGFCASTFKRGIDFVQMPTTLLSQVDSSIGGKLGIDFGEVKNSIGLFKNPNAVFIEPDFLNTLSNREIRSGFAEMIKHGLIADQAIWNDLKTIDIFEKTNWNSRISLSLKVKKQIVETDPFEKNVRKKLNFGHTVGHAVESYFLNSGNQLLHGEAIAVGMICEAWLSMKNGQLLADELKMIINYLLKIYDKFDLEQSSFPVLLKLMKNDKKNEGSAINFTFLTEPGVSIINQTCDDALILESLKYYANL